MENFYVDFFLSEKNVFFLKKNKTDTTSSDLNEFWIGQKFWKAEALLFHLSTTFMGVWARHRAAWSRALKKIPVPFFFPDVRQG